MKTLIDENGWVVRASEELAPRMAKKGYKFCPKQKWKDDRRGLNAAFPSYICKCGFIVAVGETECMNCKKPRLTQR